MKILEVKQYQASRLNIYGYTMSVILIAGSLLFTLLTIIFKINIGVASLIVWAMLIIVFYLSNNYLAEKAYADSVYKILSEDSKLSEVQLKEVIKFLITNTLNPIEESVLEDLLLKQFSKEIDTLLLHETLEHFIDFKIAEANKITSDEVSETNKL